MSSAARKIEIHKPDIFGFHDYREFLKAYFEFLKITDKKFSLRNLAQASEVAVGYLPMVLAGTRKFSEKAMEKVIPQLPLSSDEQGYLKLLCIISDSDSQAERLKAVGKLKKFKEYSEQNAKEIEVYRYLTHWYYVAIHEMATFPDFRAEADWIRERLNFSVPLAEVEEALKFLFEYKFIEKDSEGKIKATQKNIECFNGIFKLSLGEFHKQMLALASESIESVPSDKRLILGHTVAVSAEHYEQLTEILRNSLNSIRNLESRHDKMESVYHVTLATFPVAKRGDR